MTSLASKALPGTSESTTPTSGQPSGNHLGVGANQSWVESPSGYQQLVAPRRHMNSPCLSFLMTKWGHPFRCRAVRSAGAHAEVSGTGPGDHERPLEKRGDDCLALTSPAELLSSPVSSLRLRNSSVLTGSTMTSLFSHMHGPEWETQAWLGAGAPGTPSSPPVLGDPPQLTSTV